MTTHLNICGVSSACIGYCIMHYFNTCVAASLPREVECIRAIESSVSGMPGRGKRVNSTAKTIIYNVYKYFERESTKSKYRGHPHKTAEATGYPRTGFLHTSV